ncbi:MAG: hypothetical protein ACRDUW_02045 [Pseudonocardiaceae bacterium]
MAAPSRARGVSRTSGTIAQRQDALLGSLIQRVVAQATGTEVPAGVRLNDEPRRRLWLGMLASEPKLIRESDIDTINRVLPPAQGFSFRTVEYPTTLELRLSCAYYVALHPTRDEQLLASKAASDPADLDSHSDVGRPLAATWTKVIVEPVTLTVELTQPTRSSRRYGNTEFTTALRLARRLPPGGEFFRPTQRRNSTGKNPRDHDLLDEVSWTRYCTTNLVGPGDIVPPEHRAEIQIDVTTPDENGLVEVLVAVVNTTPAPDDQLIDGHRSYENRRIDTNLYEVVLITATDATVVPYELEQVARSHRYDRTVPAFGHACPVTVSTEDGRTRLRTEFAAVEPTKRVYPRRTMDPDGVGAEIDTSFASLIERPIDTVAELVDAFEDWVGQAWSSANFAVLAAERNWSGQARAEAEEEAERARAEVAWVRRGFHLLRTDAAVLDAFVATNKVMAAACEYSSWHPFQVAWILGCLPGMADPQAHPEVNIVWFATGGGKSEAYLGLMLATLFYGRYTGVTAGTQVWARFPLRLLALQQTERFAAMVLHAEIIRQDDPRTSGGDPFGIGYFVGGGNTPNKLYDAKSPYFRGQDPRAPETAEACRILQRCPICHGDLEVTFDDRAWTMWHECRNASCRLQGRLPVWGVDDDVYRNAPSVLVGTVDKLAQLGLSKDFQILLGRVHSRCPRHGYRSQPTWCAVFGCAEREQPVARGFGHVRLEIADELHLLDESLGALDGMYETLLQAISERFGNPPMQIVGATATIEGYRNQVQHLYQRDARRFPENGPVAGETFWSFTQHDEPLRRYVGVRPRIGTMVTATGEVALQHFRWVKDLVTSPETVADEAGLDSSDPEILAELREAGRELYEVLVAYCLRNEDLNTFTRDDRIRDPGPLESHRNLTVINGDSDPSDVRAAVARLVNPPAADGDRVKIIAATKAIGHGFDVARLGVMAVMGTPTQAAEIIQASARVGRVHPGLVINIANPTRDRDASVFRYYPEWIRYLDRLVHRVPVNRESLPVLQRVLSGGLMAWLLQVHDRAWITGGRRRRSLADSTGFADAVKLGALDTDMLIRDLTDGFGIKAVSAYHDMHRAAIKDWVENQMSTLPLRAEAGIRLPELLHPAVPRSLRDIQEPIVIHGEI